MFNIEKGKQAERLLVELSKPIAKRIIYLLSEINDELSVTDIYVRLRLNQSDVSQSLTNLRQTGLLNARKAGTYTFYAINKTRMNEISDFANKLSDMYDPKIRHKQIRVIPLPKRPMKLFKLID